MKVPKIFTFFLFGLAALECYGQTKFVSGYYVKAGGDTVRGFIAFRSPRANSKSFLFKGDLSDKEQEFLPKDIAGYTLQNNLFYRTYTFKEENQTVIAF